MGLSGEMSGDSNKLRNEKLYDLCSLPNILLLIESRTMRWMGHEARVGEKREQDFDKETCRKETTRKAQA